MATYYQVVLFSLIGGLFSLAGGVLLLRKKSTAMALARYATPFAAGALLAAAFLDLIPASIDMLSSSEASAWVLAGIVLFFMLEHFLYWFHHHHDHPGGSATPAPLIVIGDTLHNFLDGIAIGAAFLISAPTGIVTAIAVAAHEIPQEIGDFGLLLKFGFGRKKVLLINALSACVSTLAAVCTFWIGSRMDISFGILLAVTGGMFVYIAASDLIPIIHQQAKGKKSHLAVLLLLLGLLVVGASNKLMHQYIETHDHNSETLLFEDETHSDEH